MPNHRFSPYLLALLFLSANSLASPLLCELQWGKSSVDPQCHIKLRAANEPSGILIKGFTWDTKKESVSFKMTFKNPQQLSGFKFSFLSRGKVAATYTLPLYTDPEYNILQDNIPTELSIPLSSLKWKGAKTQSFNGLTLYLSHKNQGTQNFEVQIKEYLKTPKPQKGYASITFDDGYDSNFKAAKIMEPFKLSGTAYLIAESLNTPGYLSSEKVKQMKLWGWSFGTHLKTPITQKENLLETLLNAKKEIAKISGDKKGVDHFALPLGKYNENSLSLLRPHFQTIRLAGGSFETLPAPDAYRLKTINVTQEMKPSVVFGLCKKAIDNGDWAILMFHYLDKPSKGDLNYSSSDFKELSRLLSSLKERILPVDQVYAQ
jgi:peptidoglycan/xylan/chitin deacetylase (PgdA/CDA1 family)